MNFSITDVIGFSVILLAGWAWWHGQGVKALAYSRVKRYCEKHDLQLLDDSLALKKARPVMSKQSLVCLNRRFVFEFTTTGTYRYRGIIDMQGVEVVTISTDTHHVP